MRVLGCALILAVVLGCGGNGADRDRPVEQAVSAGTWRGNAVCYGPHRDGQRPGGEEPDREELTEDLTLMAPHWNLLRIYGSSGFAEDLLATIREREFDTKVILGVWIAPDAPEANVRETRAGIRLARAYPDVVRGVSVGNETQVDWSSHRCPVDTLVAHVRTVREAVEVPVTVADDFNFWNKPESRAVAEEIDFLMVHAHPMWNGLQLEDALRWLERTVAEVQAMHPDRPIVIGETGWATQVHDEGEQAELIKGRAGEVEQKIYYDALREWATRERRQVFWFEAFDENWKGGTHPDEVEKHWGVFTAGRTPKAAVVPGD
jgi:exo-beta-1,3-glucanase (GH17 family)